MAQKHTIKIYRTETCPYCHAEMEWLKENKIKYIDINLTKKQDKIQEMIDKSGQTGVPVTLIDEGTDEEEVIVGFDKAYLKKLFGKKTA
ncbi:MAG: glutaredoxin family protein [Candidatus Woesearchaeota archaeon]|nr:MAG: glutaredoxin family protein [Candidatus Woesearchaeota archaeon]